MDSPPPTPPLLTPAELALPSQITIVTDAQPAPVPIAPPLPRTDPPKNPSTQLTRYKFSAVKKAIDDTFNIPETNNSTICDIIAMYLKGQKLLYTEAKTVCEQRMNYLMLPAIFITATCTILSLVLKDYDSGATIVSVLSGVNAFLLALINYLKLDAKAEAHRTAAYKFDKLQSYLEFSSGKILFVTDKSEELQKIIEETESSVREVKETNQFILPESIRFAFPKLYNINVFAEVKKIQNKEMVTINHLKDVMNDLHALRTQIQEPTKDDMLEMERLEDLQKSLTDEIINMRDDYLDIDDKFEEEMEGHRGRFNRRCQPCGWLKT